MDRQKIKKAIVVMEAYLEGEIIECSNPVLRNMEPDNPVWAWRVTPEPEWNWGVYEYRVKRQ